MMIDFLYWTNYKLRILSNVVFGHIFEPSLDIVLVTGGTSGLGKEIVRLLAEKGAKVVVLDINLPQNDTEKIPKVNYFKCDVSDREQVLKVQKRVQSTIGVVTVLINNAGITTGKTVLDLTFEEIEQTIQTNLISSFYTIKAYLPSMMLKKRGYIVTIASILGYISPARLSAYGASKSGLIALHESLTYELGPPSLNPHGVKTLLVCPGQLKTGLFTGVKTPSTILAPELDPKFVASRVVRAIEEGRRGEIKLPMYGKLVPVFRALPWPVVEIARAVSGIDRSMLGFRNKIAIVASSVSSIASTSVHASAISTAILSSPAASVRTTTEAFTSPNTANNANTTRS
ncbi:hypothetical protein PVL30_005049 [Lodderomyces elongisporus]|uniref:uncharacterized protein n=1 Tax=Lodderomyces elongisporus TaxID=36914 RepID=UPI00291E21AC|nr:uncharacterized protein PVL30_005049 [Lodderomyces elongisporus]WLF81252.1 hypothetical protein PVL30_005049 [Lodderomyces elongisporus]